MYLGEYASWGNALWNAISEALYLTTLERNGDVVTMASYAPLMAKDGFTQWKTDMIFFNNKVIVPTPNYYVQKMFMTNQGDYYFDGIIEKPENDTTLAGSCVMDSNTGDIILKLVNADKEEKIVNIDLKPFNKFNLDAEKIILEGNADAINTFQNPQNVIPEKSVFKVKKKFEYSAPPMSLTVIRVRAKK